MLRILIVADDEERGTLLEEGLREAGADGVPPRAIRRIARIPDIPAVASEFRADAVLADIGAGHRSSLDELFPIVRALDRPVAVFVSAADPETVRKAVDARVAAFVVDGLKKERVGAVLDVAISRHEAIVRLEGELAEARNALRERTFVERAKALLMERRRLTEHEAYALLRRTAMSTNRRIADLARSIVEASTLLSEESKSGAGSWAAAIEAARPRAPRAR